MVTERGSDHGTNLPETPESLDVVGWAGIGFAVISAGLYGLLFYMLTQLPSTRNEMEQLRTNAPALTRLLVVAASAAIFNIVAMVLCLSGFLSSRQPRTLSVIGSTITVIMLIGVFSVVVVSLIIAPR